MTLNIIIQRSNLKTRAKPLTTSVIRFTLQPCYFIKNVMVFAEKSRQFCSKSFTKTFYCNFKPIFTPPDSNIQVDSFTDRHCCTYCLKYVIPKSLNIFKAKLQGSKVKRVSLSSYHGCLVSNNSVFNPYL